MKLPNKLPKTDIKIPRYKRIDLACGATARVSEDCPKKTIDALNEMVKTLQISFVKGKI